MEMEEDNNIFPFSDCAFREYGDLDRMADKVEYAYYPYQTPQI